MALKPRSKQPAVDSRSQDEKQQRRGTDESLRTERDTADSRGEEQRANDAADHVVDLARERADAVLTEARDRADQEADSLGPGPGRDDDQERAEADALVNTEREAADEFLRREREDAARLLSALLPLARNKTDRRLLTERVASDEALSARDDFLGIVSHDLNNLLASIVLTADLLARRASDAPGTKQRVAAGAGRILLYAARMKRLIGDLVDVTSLAEGKLAVVPAPTDAGTLITEALESFRLLAPEKRILLQAETPPEPMQVVCDRGRILQVLANLVGNAIKFASSGARISASVAQVGGEVRFSVSDTGPGIPEHLLGPVFERFWQVGEDDRRGLGLGLYIARSIVEAHNGKISAKNREGGGAVFQFTLPSCPEPDGTNRPPC